MSQIWPSDRQAPAALVIAVWTLMSWQAREGEPPREVAHSVPSSRKYGDTVAAVGSSSGTSMIEILLWPPPSSWRTQFGPSAAPPSGYDDTYTNTRSLSGTSVWVWEPQSVATDLRWTGFAGSDTSKMRTPSNMPGVLAVTFVLSQPPWLCGASTDWNSR